ncbi:hypothetical protein E2562_021753 [Oryza meyeriana var. granulata]|uniref:Uncharacterized protein n=1 Tax=Oryza meyeriana var. granulata TaxID=110450 RepID=A0A6G1EY55_9ORYZ|nr:hypothetical protein E2562_021753 [Oryza meyeriana var. granulata]
MAVGLRVKVHVAKHECASTRRDEKVKRASKAWICEKDRELDEHEKSKVELPKIGNGTVVLVPYTFYAK